MKKLSSDLVWSQHTKILTTVNDHVDLYCAYSQPASTSGEKIDWSDPLSILSLFGWRWQKAWGNIRVESLDLIFVVLRAATCIFPEHCEMKSCFGGENGGEVDISRRIRYCTIQFLRPLCMLKYSKQYSTALLMSWIPASYGLKKKKKFLSTKKIFVKY